ncbi:MAG: hypothetical protein OEX11_04000, partial [Nitrosomonas sp.]|nr:hypothetical protein [Nitrosomonas sp.]
PYLPLVDEVISSLNLFGKRKLQIFTSEGVTELIPPRSIFKRWMAGAKLNFRFSEYARMRNWQETSRSDPASYINALKELGFDVKIKPYKENNIALSEDPSVHRFFPAVALVPAPDLWQRLKDYFFSAYENSLFELAVFTVIAILLFSGRHLYINYKINKTRQTLPLVVGGWGTRGKSGTERIKAAMFNALGYSLVLKTTGCEAMFLHSAPNGKMYEMFLFRPYDKATIWEQYDVMRYAEALSADVFLWECMALNPDYVKILQQNWVRDDISTITNTYPDHEDIQGPAGINIPEVMTNFIPKSGVLLTTEDQMRPILSEDASKKNTVISSVGWLEAGLLTPDILERFPYEEHPDNIVLVLRLGEELGIAPDFALKEMADRVVADLGVLKTFPVACLNTRKLQFTNGMSANERFGCLSNWRRMDFDKQDYVNEPGVWITTVVNNRADRVARSEVFANLIVTEINVDQHFLIGNNLSGLLGYIQEAWKNYSAQLTLWSDLGEVSPEEVFLQFVLRFRVAYTSDLVIARLQAMLVAQPDIPKGEVANLCALWDTPQMLREKLALAGIERDLNAIMFHHELNMKQLAAYDIFVEKIRNSSDKKELDKSLRQQLYHWFSEKINVIEDSHATGDEIITHICEATPPGFLNRIMGIQNIKGTGLDFVYRWQAWDTCYEACNQLRAREYAAVLQGLQTLSTFREYGPLCVEYVGETIVAAKHNPYAQRESAQAEITIIGSNLELCLREASQKSGAVRKEGWFAKIVEVVEAFLDAGDAVKRRKIADKIYLDLVSERISIERAVLELQKLNKRQKGGWLLTRLPRNS